MSNDLAWTPQDFGFSAWSFDPILSNFVSGISDRLVCFEIKISSKIISRVSFCLQNENELELEENQNFIGIYNIENRLLGETSDLTNIFKLKSDEGKLSYANIGPIFLPDKTERIKVAILANRKPEHAAPSFVTTNNSMNKYIASRSFQTINEIDSLPKDLTELEPITTTVWLGLS